MGAGNLMSTGFLQELVKRNELIEGQSLFDKGTELAEMLQPEAPLFLPFTSVSDGVESTALTARDQVLMEHLPTVRYIARRIHDRLPQHVELDDLVSAGIVGLIDAFAKFDHGKKVQFKSYAQFRIRGAILDSLRTLDWSPRELRRKGARGRGGDSLGDAAAWQSAGGTGDRSRDGTDPRRISSTARRSKEPGDWQPSHGAVGGLRR